MSENGFEEVFRATIPEKSLEELHDITAHAVLALQQRVEVLEEQCAHLWIGLKVAGVMIAALAVSLWLR